MRVPNDAESSIAIMKTTARKNLGQIGLACAALGCLASSLPAATIFLTDENAVASAKWDTWSWAEKTAGSSGSQGAAQNVTSNGAFAFTGTDVTTSILLTIGPAGGLIAGGDTFYAFDGAFAWSVTGEFNANVDFVRVSYSLVPDDRGTNPFPNGPALDIGATEYRSGVYEDLDNGRAIFFMDFALTNPSSAFTATFGDNAIPPIPHQSHRSLDAIQIEGFSGIAPSPIPEPSTYALGAGIGALGLAFLRRRFRRS